MSLHEPDFSSDPQSLTVDSIQWECHRFTDLAVLCFIVVNGRILLINKKRGLGAGKVNGPGGRLERGETPEQAAVRETQEEVGLTPTGLEKRAELSFVFTDGYSLFVSAFFANGFTGTPIETDEALPFWCPVPEIPYGRMWADDRLWLPEALSGAFVRGRFVFDNDGMRSNRIEIDRKPKVS